MQSNLSPNAIISILLICCISATHSLFSQSSFSIRLGTFEDDTYPSITVLDEDQYLLCYFSRNASFEKNTAFVKLLSAEGQVVDSILFQDDDYNYCLLSPPMIHEGYIFTFGSKKNQTSENDNLWITKLDMELNLLWEKEIQTPFTEIKQCEFDGSYSNSVLAGVSGAFIDGTRNMGFYKFNKNLEFEKDSIYELNGWQWIFDISKIPNSPNYFGFTMGMETTTYNQRLTIDTNLHIHRIDTMPNNIYNAVHCEWLNDTTYILCGSKYFPFTGNDTTYIAVQKMDTAQIVSEFKIFNYKTGKLHQPAAHNGLTKFSNDNFYLGGTCNLHMSFSPTHSWVMVNKMDALLNIKWQKFMGGDANYTLHSMQSTIDGGCIITGTRYDWLTQNQERDIFVIKMDENGVITNTPEQQYTEAQPIQVFPNPGSRYFQVQMPWPHALIQLYNMQGIEVMQEQLTRDENIKTSHLPKGVYLYRLIGPKNQTASGKWIKE